MLYQSTRDASLALTAAEAIARGLSRDGGLFVPAELPALPGGAIEAIAAMPYRDRAVYVMKLFLDDFSEEELDGYAGQAYGGEKFSHAEIAPVRAYDENTHFLELWHGPTSAFKDMALQMLPHFLTASLEKTGETRDVCILVATSGDTGKAALEGFRDVARTKIMVFYPRDGVSDVQKLQMMTQGGGNVGVLSVKGNFDDAQNGVKEIFSDGRLREALETRGWFLSSANSINWGRLLPQIVYYVSAYCDLYRRGAISAGQEINFCVPTGNFGNILAGYYAKKLGLPIKTLICASNRNDVLTDFINTGVYDRNRAFFTTLSPSMDILVSSNLERLLFDLSGADDALTASYMRALGDGGRYEANAEIRAAVARDFACGCLDDERTKKTIAEVFKTGYLIDTHTAVAYGVLNDYRARTGDAAPAVVVSTASPFKFCDSVLDALGQPSAAPGLELIDALAAFSGAEAPKQLRALRGKRVRFDGAAEKSGMRAAVEDFLK